MRILILSFLMVFGFSFGVEAQDTAVQQQPQTRARSDARSLPVPNAEMKKQWRRGVQYSEEQMKENMQRQANRVRSNDSAQPPQWKRPTPQHTTTTRTPPPNRKPPAAPLAMPSIADLKDPNQTAFAGLNYAKVSERIYKQRTAKAGGGDDITNSIKNYPSNMEQIWTREAIADVKIAEILRKHAAQFDERMAKQLFLKAAEAQQKRLQFVETQQVGVKATDLATEKARANVEKLKGMILSNYEYKGGKDKVTLDTDLEEIKRMGIKYGNLLHSVERVKKRLLAEKELGLTEDKINQIPHPRHWPKYLGTVQR